MKKSKIWKNIIMYVSASLDQQEDASSEQESEDLNTEMYVWLQSNFNISRKKRKPTIFDLMKNKSGK